MSIFAQFVHRVQADLDRPTQQALADRLGVPQGVIGRYLDPEYDPRLSTVQKLMEANGWRLDRADPDWQPSPSDLATAPPEVLLEAAARSIDRSAGRLGPVRVGSDADPPAKTAPRDTERKALHGAHILRDAPTPYGADDPAALAARLADLARRRADLSALPLPLGAPVDADTGAVDLSSAPVVPPEHPILSVLARSTHHEATRGPVHVLRIDGRGMEPTYLDGTILWVRAPRDAAAAHDHALQVVRVGSGPGLLRRVSRTRDGKTALLRPVPFAAPLEEAPGKAVEVLGVVLAVVALP